MGRPPDPRCVQFRGFVRDFMLTQRAQQRVRKAILEDSRVLVKAMDICAGRMDEEAGAGGVSSPVFIMLAERLAVLPPEALEAFARTGELDPASYLQDVAPRALATQASGERLANVPLKTSPQSEPDVSPTNATEKPHRERILDALIRYVDKTGGLAPTEGQLPLHLDRGATA